MKKRITLLCIICVFMMLISSCSNSQTESQIVRPNSDQTQNSNTENSVSNANNKKNTNNNTYKESEVFEIPADAIRYEVVNEQSLDNYQYCSYLWEPPKQLNEYLGSQFISGLIITGVYTDFVKEELQKYDYIRLPDSIENNVVIGVIIDCKKEFKDVFDENDNKTLILPDSLTVVQISRCNVKLINIENAEYIIDGVMYKEPKNSKFVSGVLAYDYSSIPDADYLHIILAGNHVGKKPLVIDKKIGYVANYSRSLEEYHGFNDTGNYPIVRVSNLSAPKEVVINDCPNLILGIVLDDNSSIIVNGNIKGTDTHLEADSIVFNDTDKSPISVRPKKELVLNGSTTDLGYMGYYDFDAFIGRAKEISISPGLVVYNNTGKVFNWGIFGRKVSDKTFETGRLDFGSYYVDVKKSN